MITPSQLTKGNVISEELCSLVLTPIEGRGGSLPFF